MILAGLPATMVLAEKGFRCRKIFRRERNGLVEGKKFATLLHIRGLRFGCRHPRIYTKCFHIRDCQLRFV